MKEETRYPEYLPISSGVGATCKSSIRKVKNGIKVVIMKVLQKTIDDATNNFNHGKGVGVDILLIFY
jgi:hypothetical protein